MRRLTLGLCAALCAMAPNAQDIGPRLRAAIAAPEGHSHYTVRLPAAVYAGIERSDLGDLRVLNAHGEAVPYAFLPRESSGKAPLLAAAARLFPLYGRESQGVEGVKLDVVRGAGGTVIRLAEAPQAKAAGRKLLGYVADAGEDARPIEALELDWRAAAGFNGSAKVEASDDLARWHTLVADAPILELAHAGERLERRRIELRGHKARYLRLAFAGVPEGFELRRVRMERRGERAEPEREWKRLEAAQTNAAGEYRFEAGGRYPADRLRLDLPQQNTVARVQILSRDGDDQPWRHRASATVYRLQRDGATVTSPEVQVPAFADRHWLVKADSRGGGLGAGAVALELGWTPHELVFAARGAAPFTLAFGERRMRPEALSVSSVVPGYEAGKPLAAQAAQVGAVEPARAQAAFLSDPLGWLRATMSGGRGKTWLLWLVLGAGVLAVAWMALRLLRELGTKPPPSS
jgi:hypothetical protein